MELIAAVMLAGPLGYFCRTRRRGLGLYLLAWAAIFPLQTAVVLPNDDQPVAYFAVSAVILAAGVGLNAIGARLRERRGGRVHVAAS
jgi:hypothetical protein